MKLLVTGHLGYLGVEMTSRLLAAGHEVVGLDIDYFADCDFVAPPDDVPNLRTDLRDVEPEELEGFDAVIHLAALSNDPLSDLNPDLTYDINLHASVRLATAAKQAGVAAVPVLLVVQPLRRRREASCSTRTRRSTRSRPTASRRSASSRRCRSWPTTRSPRSTCATRPRSGRRADSAPTSSSTTWSGTR